MCVSDCSLEHHSLLILEICTNIDLSGYARRQAGIIGKAYCHILRINPFTLKTFLKGTAQIPALQDIDDSETIIMLKLSYFTDINYAVLLFTSQKTWSIMPLHKKPGASCLCIRNLVL